MSWLTIAKAHNGHLFFALPRGKSRKGLRDLEAPSNRHRQFILLVLVHVL